MKNNADVLKHVGNSWVSPRTEETWQFVLLKMAASLESCTNFLCREMPKHFCGKQWLQLHRLSFPPCVLFCASVRTNRILFSISIFSHTLSRNAIYCNLFSISLVNRSEDFLSRQYEQSGKTSLLRTKRLNEYRNINDIR